MCGVGFVFQAEDGIRDLVRSRGLGDVYKRQQVDQPGIVARQGRRGFSELEERPAPDARDAGYLPCLLYTSDAADERSSVDLGGRRIIKKKTNVDNGWSWDLEKKDKSNRKAQQLNVK